MRMVRFESNGGMAQGSKLFDVETGAGISGLRRVVATVEVDTTNKVEAEFILAEVVIDGHLIAKVRDPKTGDLRRISKIVWDDGEEWLA